MLVASLFLGTYLSGTMVDRDDAVMHAYFDLMKLSYACNDPLYHSKKEAAQRWAARHSSLFKAEDVSTLDGKLKNGDAKPDRAVAKGDCIVLLSDAQAKIDRLSAEFSQ